MLSQSSKLVSLFGEIALMDQIKLSEGTIER